MLHLNTESPSDPPPFPSIPSDMQRFLFSKYFKLHELIPSLYVNKNWNTFFKKVTASTIKNYTELLKASAEHGNRALLIWAKTIGFPFNRYSSFPICEGAASGGQLEVLKWLKENDCPLGPSISPYAAFNGHLEVLKWLEQYSGRANCDIIQKAAKGGRFEVLKWLYLNHYHLNKHTFFAAAEEGHLEILKWLIARGHRPWIWDKSTSRYAVLGGHLDVLKWLRENRCPWNKQECINEAKNKGHLEILEWIESQND